MVASNRLGRLLVGLTVAWVCNAGCGTVDETDNDGDGAPISVDCDDLDPSRGPGAPEVCDGVDNDCDGDVDEGATLPFHPDADGDGFGDQDVAVDGCAAPAGAVVDGTDCDDGDGSVHPGADDVCDAIDQDCDGSTDEGWVSLFADLDGDGFGDQVVVGCPGGSDVAAIGGDCDDADPSVNPRAPEVCDGIDQDCDGLVDDGTGTLEWPDLDGDGYGDAASAPAPVCSPPEPGWSPNALDCDDDAPTVFVGAPERCDGLDNDCDLAVDEGVTERFWTDADGDGYGDPAAPTEACAPGAGVVANALDCDDLEPLAHSGGTEVCDGVDNDCDTLVDEFVALTWYDDVDGDGFGAAGTEVTGCAPPASAVAFVGTDCDDADASVHPGRAEACDGVDDDCDGDVDEGLLVAWWVDGDGDGYGDPLQAGETCEAPAGTVGRAGDCDDASADARPDAVEACNAIDDDCDGRIDDGLAEPWWPDVDGDGFGDADTPAVVTCTPDPGWVPQPGDCADDDPTVYVGQIEVCDGIDQDCDGAVDDGLVGQWWPDADGDGFGDADTSPELTCAPPFGWVDRAGDCDDAADTVHVTAAEVCNGIDDDCDGVPDDEITVPWWPDVDADTYGDATVAPTRTCAPDPSWVARGGDCDDAVAEVHPTAVELCNAIDDDCDGLADEGITVPYWPDADGDGYGDASAAPTLTCAPPGGTVDRPGDCADDDPTAHPLAVEACDGVDDDCDGVIDEGVALLAWVDADGDGWGAPGAPSRACVALPYTADVAGDCDDGDPAVGGSTCAQTLAGGWPTFGGDDERSGHAPGFVGVAPPAFAWSFSAPSAGIEPVAIADGVVYAVVDGWAFGADDHVVALDLQTGAVAWDAPIDDSLYPTAPTVEDGVVYLQRVNSFDADVLAFDAATGMTLWATPFSVQWEQFWAPLVLDGHVVVGGGFNGGLYGFRAADGVQEWFVFAPWVGQWTPAGHAGVAYTQLDDAFTAWNLANGHEIGSFGLNSLPFRSEMGTVPAIGGGVAVMVDGSDLVAVDLASLDLVWSIRDGFTGSPSVADGLAYAIRDGDVVQVHLGLGDIVGVYSVGDLVGKPVVTEDAVIAASATDTWVFRLWEDAPPGRIRHGGELAVGEGAIAIGDGATVEVYALP